VGHNEPETLRLTGPSFSRPLTSAPPNYRGCSPTLRRRGIVRTTRTADVLAIRRGRRALGRPLPRPADFVNLELEPDAYAGVACWSGGPAYWAHVTVAIAYELRYKLIRPLMCNGGIGKETLIVIAAAMAHHADWDTGRNCRPTNEQLTVATGFHERTIQRAHECLRLLGMATEILRGRQRTYIERMASWRMGDRHRGWASVWALHDNPQVNRAIHNLSPHLERSQVTTTTSPSERLITTRGRSRARQSVATRRQAQDEGGRQLALQWRADRTAPPWARRYSARSWAAVLAKPAAAGWTARDLTQLVRDWLGTGHRIPDSPDRPIGLIGAILAWHISHNSLLDRPAAADEAREAAELAARDRRMAAAAVQHAAHTAGRAVGRAARTGEGHAAAMREAARIAAASARKRADAAAAEERRIAEAVQAQRSRSARHPEQWIWR
jgi:hypothetical protein